jgi:hypothetical protein
MYVSAEGGGDSILVANRTSASGWETFKVTICCFHTIIIDQFPCLWYINLANLLSSYKTVMESKPVNLLLEGFQWAICQD